jgi:hypothetical protein
MIEYWWNPSTDTVYGESGVSSIIEEVTYRGLPTYILKTPNVVAAAQEHFGCDTLTGM